MIDELVKNLDKGRNILENISQKEYTNKSIAPYYSSIGAHIRHILDMYNCVFKGLKIAEIDFTSRDRNIEVENFPTSAIKYLEFVTQKLQNLKLTDMEIPVKIIDDLGSGTHVFKSTLGAVLAQTQSHTTHHYASIGYMIHNLSIGLPDASFGLNPTTPKNSLITSYK